MTLSSFLFVLTAVVVTVAFVRLRRAAKRLDRLAESYWQMRYEQGQMSARLTRLEKGLGPTEMPEPAPANEPPRTAFVPLSSLKKTQ